MDVRGKKILFFSAIVSFVTGVIYGGFKVSRIIGDEMKNLQNRQDLFEGLYRPINEWFAKEQSGHTLKDYLEKKQYKKIGIFGMGNLANRVYDALKSSDIEIVCCIDQSRSVYSDTKLISINDEFPLMDAIIITDFKNSASIKQQIEKKGNYDILLLDDIIFNEL